MANSPVIYGPTGITGLTTQTANQIFAAPNGSNGNPVFRSLVTADLPAGTANVTTILFASSQVTTLSSNITVSTFTTFSNSPALSFTPTITGTYKVYASIPLYANSGTGATAVARIFNTTGGATLLYESQIVAAGPTAANVIEDSGYAISYYTLTAGTAYVFDIQGKLVAGTNANCDGANSPFYMFAEAVLTSPSSLVIGTIDGQTGVANGLQIVASTLYAQSATASVPGMVNNGVQTFSGAKTVSSLFSATNGITVTGATTNANAGLSVTGTSTLGTAAANQTTIGAASSTAVHVINGGLRVTTNTVTTTYTVDNTTTDCIILVDTSGAAFTITFPAPTNGRILFFKDKTGSFNTNNLTLARHAAEKIDGVAASKLLTTNWGDWMYTSDGTDWFSI